MLITDLIVRDFQLHIVRFTTYHACDPETLNFLMTFVPLEVDGTEYLGKLSGLLD